MTVHQCPQNKSNWDTASQKLQCVDPNSYHCLRTEDGGETEQCLSKVWIQDGMCPEYNSKVGKIDVFPCSHFQNCPTEIYWSNEIYKYPICSRKTSSAATTTRNPQQGNGGSSIDKDESSNVYIISSVVSCIILLIGIGIICFILKRKRIRRNQEETHIEHQTTTGDRLLAVNADMQNDFLLRKLEPQDKDKRVGITSEDTQTSDIKDLKKYGVLIFISDDKIGMGSRIRVIDECGLFGESRHFSPFDQWEPEENISLYLSRQPISDLQSLIEFLHEKIDDIYKRVTSQEIYFVLEFTKDEWQRNQNLFFRYDFFRNAITKKI